MTRIRQATLQDMPQLVRLFDDYRVFYRQKSDLNTAETFLQERITKAESVIFVAEIDNQLVGFTQLYPLFSSVRMKRLWLLNDLFVQPASRGKGISKQLINRAKQLAVETQAAGLTLETEQTNDIGNQLYPTVGFTRNADHNFYDWTTPD
ncbi:MAG: GNAT family N-acetyltransferase [Thermonemataceae bacterium]